MTIDPNNRKRARATRGNPNFNTTDHFQLQQQQNSGMVTSNNNFVQDDPHSNNANERNWHEEVQASDGNCLYRSVSDQMYGTPEFHEMVRKKCFEYMRLERAHFQNFLNVYEDGDFDSYVDRKQQLGVWADDMEIQCLSEIYDSGVEIYDPDGNLQKTFHEHSGMSSAKGPINAGGSPFVHQPGGGSTTISTAVNPNFSNSNFNPMQEIEDDLAAQSAWSHAVSAVGGSGAANVVNNSGGGSASSSSSSNNNPQNNNYAANYNNNPLLFMQQQQNVNFASYPPASAAGSATSFSRAAHQHPQRQAQADRKKSKQEDEDSFDFHRLNYTVIRLTYRGQSHYNSLRDMNTWNARAPQIGKVRTRFLKKTNSPEHSISWRLEDAGSVEDFAIQIRKEQHLRAKEAMRRQRELEQMAHQGGLQAGTSRAANPSTTTTSASNLLQMNASPLTTNAPSTAAGQDPLLLQQRQANEANFKLESEFMQKAQQESLEQLQKQEEMELKKALMASLDNSTSFIPTAVTSSMSTTSADAPAAGINLQLQQQQTLQQPSSSASTDDEALLQEALLLSMGVKSNAGSTTATNAEQGKTAAAPPSGKEPVSEATSSAGTSTGINTHAGGLSSASASQVDPNKQVPDAVIQCMSMGVPLEKAWKAYEFAGPDLDEMILFITNLG
ncbi:unnamed protein product [Amoebophrya sp. A120]|nr:unnamed protein product [Amoebophrya sp. A120]|eukprot:GSA120T00024132001.1